MKGARSTLVFLATVSLLSALALAQHKYDPGTEVTVSGTVMVVMEPKRADEAGVGVHLLVTTKEGVVEVHLAPGWYLKEIGLKPAVGDQVEITGSNVVEDHEEVVARKVALKHEEFLLRDTKGVPKWSKGRKPVNRS